MSLRKPADVTYISYMDSVKIQEETQNKLALQRHLSHDDLSPIKLQTACEAGIPNNGWKDCD
jgi:hypothetical protein